MNTTRQSRGLLAAMVAAVLAGEACAGKKDVSLEIQLDKGLVGDVVWFEVGAFRDSSCAAVSPMLADGLPQTASARVAFRRDAPATPTFGDLDRGKYAFAAVARAEDCGVLATACSEVDVASSSSVSLNMRATDAPTGACGKGAVCQAARCVPASDNQDPSVGTQCSLELLGAGPLALSLGAGASLSAPAISSTPSGFIIAYKEIDSSGATARITALPIDPAGGALTPGTAALKGRCATDETDGVGLVLNGADGKIILARSACGAKPALEVLSFSTTPEATINQTFLPAESSTVQKFALSNAHVSATRAGSNVVVYTEDGAAKIASVLPGAAIDLKAAGTFGGTVGITGAWVATSDKVLAALAAGPPSSSEPIPDGGLDGSNEGGASSSGGAGGGGDATPTLSLVMVPPDTAANAFDANAALPRAPLTFPGLWGAVAALGSRVIVVSDGGGPRSVSYRTFDLGRTDVGDSNGFSVEGGGVVTTADVTMIDNKVYFAALKPGGVSLHVFANATTVPIPLREIAFAKEPRIPSVAGVRDTGRVAVAATSSRVAVAWTTAKTLTNNDSTGGYAVFACTP